MNTTASSASYRPADPRAYLKQLQQLASATWDGDLLSKQVRDQLVRDGMAAREDGWNIATARGIGLLVSGGLLQR